LIVICYNENIVEITTPRGCYTLHTIHDKIEFSTYFDVHVNLFLDVDNALIRIGRCSGGLNMLKNFDTMNYR